MITPNATIFLVMNPVLKSITMYVRKNFHLTLHIISKLRKQLVQLYLNL